ncbi:MULTISPECIES: Cys-tRNA(Pro) deacylase [unclassified Moraxella]|uniref:Cys-tRNA(Pro) deacylase n=1 Tax=unclassified Moraxella TaxID=2685852 RepID=UPI003AF9AE07
MTPAINIAKKLKLNFQIHEYQHDPNSDSYGLEAAEKMGVDPARVFKTLVVADEHGKLAVAVAVVPVEHRLNLKKIAKAVGLKKMDMADPKLVERTTGYVLGGVSPLGQKKRLPTVIDITAKDLVTMFCSAGRRGLEIELSPQDLANALGASFVEITQD